MPTSKRKAPKRGTTSALSKNRPPICNRGASGSDLLDYVEDPEYAADRLQLIRSYDLLARDLRKIFDYVDPTDANKQCFSHQIYAILLRAATEFETHAKAILRANGYKGNPTNWKIRDFRKIEDATKLSEYRISFPSCGEGGSLRHFSPFQQWANGGHSLGWYQAYNQCKHNRHECFPEANLQNAVYGVSAVFAILFAQFNTRSFSPHSLPTYEVEPDGSEFETHSNSLFAVQSSRSWTDAQKYDFEWEQLKSSQIRFHLDLLK